MIDVDAEVEYIKKRIYAAFRVKNNMTINMNLKYYGIAGKCFIVQGARRSGKTTVLENIIKNTNNQIIAGGLFSNSYTKNPNIVWIGQLCVYTDRLLGRIGKYSLFVDEVSICNKDNIGELLDRFSYISSQNSVSYFSVTDHTNIVPIMEHWYPTISKLSTGAKETAAQQLLNGHRLTDRKDIIAFFYPGFIEDLNEMEEEKDKEGENSMTPICENCKHYQFLDSRCNVHPEKMNVQKNQTCKDFHPYK